MSFSCYPKYKDSRVDWIGEVPEGWSVARLGFECETIVPMRDKPEHLGGEIPWIRIEDFNGKFIGDSKSGQGISPETVNAMNLKVLPVGAVLCSCSCSMGTTAIVVKPLVTNQTFIGVVPGKVFLSDYLYFFFQAAGDHLNSIGTGAIQSYLSRDDFRRLRLPCPSFAEQTAIATFLDRETAKMDALVAEQEKLIAILKEKRQAVISHAVTKGLDPSVPMKDSGVEWLGEVPEGWGIKPLKYVVLMKSGDQITAEDINESGEYPVFGGNGLRGYAPIYTHDGWFPLIGRQGALCGNVNYAMGKFWASEHAVVVTPQTDCNILWLGELLRTMNLGKYSITAAQPGLSVDVIRNLRIPFPKISEQRTIASFLDRETAKIDSLTAEAERGIVLLKERRGALISAAVTGEIDVRAFLQIPTNAQPWRTHD